MTTTTLETRLQELLVAEHVLTQEEIDQVLKIQERLGGRFEEVLIDSGHLHMDAFEAFLVGQPGVASIDLTQYKALGELCDLVPEEFARTNKIFPIDRMGKLLTIGMALPLDTETIAELETLTELRVKAVYCSPAHIQGAINRYYVSEELAVLGKYHQLYERARGSSSIVRIGALLRNIDDLPSLPETVRKVKEALDDPNIAMDEVEGFIRTDPLVSANLLKLANSAAFKFSGQVDDVGMALRLLGLRETYSMVLASAVLTMAEGTEGIDVQRMWREAMFAASAVPVIAKEAGIVVTSALSTTGLLHDIGRFGLAQVSPRGYSNIDADCVGTELVEIEEEKVGLGHPEAGYVIAEHWELPEEIATLIRYHHAPEKAEDLKEEACITCLAAFLSEANSTPSLLNQEEPFAQVQYALDTLNLSAERILELYLEISVDFADN